MKVGFSAPTSESILQEHILVKPDFWIASNNKISKDIATFKYLPSANYQKHGKIIKSGKVSVEEAQVFLLKENQKKLNTDTGNSTTYVVVNEVFDEKNKLRNCYTVDFFQKVFEQVKLSGAKTVFNEHRLITLFLVRQRAFIKLIEPLIKEGLIDYVGLQIWDIGRPLEFSMIWLLIKLFQAMGVKVLISEFGIYEPDPIKQAFRANEWLKMFADAGVESVGYWWLRDGPHTAMPLARDSSKNPGLYTENWEPKPILEIFAKYVETPN